MLEPYFCDDNNMIGRHPVVRCERGAQGVEIHDQWCDAWPPRVSVVSLIVSVEHNTTLTSVRSSTSAAAIV